MGRMPSIQKKRRSGDGFFQAVKVLSAHVLGYQDGDAAPDPEKETEQKIHRLRGGAHGRQRYRTAVIPDDKGICGTVKLLQNVAQTDGERKQQGTGENGTAGHICFFCMHNNTSNLAGRRMILPEKCKEYMILCK